MICEVKESKTHVYLEAQTDEFKKLLIINQVIKYFEMNPKI